MINTLFLTVAAITGIATRIRYARWRRREPGSGAIMVQLASLFLALVFIAPITQRLASEVIPSLGRLLSNMCTLAAAFGFVQFQLTVTCDDPATLRRKIYPRAAGLAAVEVALIITFFLANRPTGLGLFKYAGSPPLIAYILIYSEYFTIAVIDLLALAARSIPRTRGSLRVSLVTLSAGYALALFYIGAKVEYVIRAILGATGGGEKACVGGPFNGFVCTTQVAMPALSVLIIVAGISIRPLLKLLSGLACDVKQLQSLGISTYWRLHPMWLEFMDAMPQIEYSGPSAVENTPRWELLFKTYRRIVEVRDGTLLLEPYRSVSDTAAHRQRADIRKLRGEFRDAAVEAADLRVALRRYKSEGRARPQAGRRPDASRLNLADDLAREARWLALVSRAFSKSSIGDVNEESARASG